MQSDIFQAGTVPGSPSGSGEVKMLLCYLLAPMERPVRFDVLHEALRSHELVNYFTLVEVLDQLADTGHLEISAELDGATGYLATGKARDMMEELTSDLPQSVREKARDALDAVLRRRRRLSEVTILEEPSGGGCVLELRIPDGGQDLLSLRIFAPSAQQRDLIKRRFLNDPVYLYSQITALLTGDRGNMPEGESAGDLF